MGQGEGVEAIKLNRTRRKKQSTFKQLQQERKLIEETGSSVGDFQVTKLERERERAAECAILIGILPMREVYRGKRAWSG